MSLRERLRLFRTMYFCWRAWRALERWHARQDEAEAAKRRYEFWLERSLGPGALELPREG